MNAHTEYKANDINQFKREKGMARKEIPRPKRKHADSERLKRMDNVAMQHQSKTENQFEMEHAMIPQNKEEWPYEGISNFLEGLRMKSRLGDGW